MYIFWYYSFLYHIYMVRDTIIYFQFSMYLQYIIAKLEFQRFN